MVRFEIRNPSGQKIVGLVNKPKAEPPFETLIYAHGFKGYKEQRYLEFIASDLSKKGICVIRFDGTNGIGESEGDIFDITPTHYLNDFRAVFNYIRGLDFVKKDAIHVGGSSFGGMVAIIFASENPQIKSLILQAPVYELKELHKDIDLNKWKKQGYWIFHSSSKNIDVKVSYRYYSECLKYNMRKFALKIKIPTLIIHGSADNSVPLEQSQSLLRDLKIQKELFIIKGAPHTMKKECHLGQFSEKIRNWLDLISKSSAG